MKTRRGCDLPRPKSTPLLSLFLAALLLPERCGGGALLQKAVTRLGLAGANQSTPFFIALACPDAAAALHLSVTALTGSPLLFASASLQTPPSPVSPMRPSAARRASIRSPSSRRL
jgi:hypothetical protein